MADFYDVLEVPRSASEQDIKKAYRKLALKWHPDKNLNNKEEASNRFKEISEAYEILSNQNSKDKYDRYGRDGLTGDGRSAGGNMDFNFGFHFHSPDEIFRNFFGTNDPFANMFDGMDDMPGFGGNSSLFSRKRPSNNRREHSFHNAFSDPFSGMGFGNGFGMGFGNGFGHDPFNSPSFASFSSFGNGGGGGNMKSTSTSTKYVNGNQITKMKTVENGRETVEEYENGTLIRRMVDGISLQITQ